MHIDKKILIFIHRSLFVKQNKQRLSKEILLLVVLKLVAISALWWYFVRDARFIVDTETAAQHIGSQGQPQLSGRNP